MSTIVDVRRLKVNHHKKVWETGSRVTGTLKRRDEKATRCHSMIYSTYDTLNMFRELLCPSSRARDCVCVCVCVLLPPMVCSAWLLVVGGQVQGSRLCVHEEGCCTTAVVQHVVQRAR